MLVDGTADRCIPAAYITSADGFVQAFDTTTNTVVGSPIAVAAGFALNSVTFNPSGTHAYVATGGKGTVALIEVATNSVVSEIPVGLNAFGVAVAPDDSSVYATDEQSASLFLIPSLSTVKVGSSPREVAFNPAGTRAYVANRADDTVSFIDTATTSVVATVPVDRFPTGLVVDGTGRRVYVTAAGGGVNGTVSVIDTSFFVTVDTIEVGLDPRGIAINPAGTRLYVAVSGNGVVAVVDTTTTTAIATIPTGTTPRGVGINPAGTRVFVTNYGSATVAVIDTATNSLVATVPTFGVPLGIAVSPLPP